MRRIIILLILSQISLSNNAQIIADHTIVSDFDKIPPYYLDEVKKMFVSVAGESHSEAVRYGSQLLQQTYPAYQVSVQESGTPEAYTTEHLRLSRVTWGDFSNSSGWIYDYGEEDWFTNTTAIERTKAGIAYCNTNGLALAAIGFGWCSDMVYSYGVSSAADPVYGCHWYGASKEGPDGDRGWGMDAEDLAITGNRVNLDTYLNATEEYRKFCETNGYSTKVYFTTGPVDSHYDAGERGYSGFIKHGKIRDFVKADNSRILFDYADILCYDNDGTAATATWNGHTFPIITTTNLGDAYVGHIGSEGCIRLAKAMWWMLARMAGWDGTTATVPVTAVTVTGANGSNTITSDNGTLILTAAVFPDTATNKTVTWSIANGTGKASISTSGVVTAIANGTVTAKATANDGSGIFGTFVISISNQVMPVTGITVTGGTATISTNNGTLQLIAVVSPSDAADKTVTWSIANGTGNASISTSGVVTAVANGTVTAKATANDGSGIFGTYVITISNQDIPVTGITITGGTGTISTINGTLQLIAVVSPSDATNKTVTWSIANETGLATIDASGLVTAVANGTVTAKATSNDGSGIHGTIAITISNQYIPVEVIEIFSENGSDIITRDIGTLQLIAQVLPATATVKTVTWTIVNNTGQASVTPSGLVTAIKDGTVTAMASATDGSGVIGTMEINCITIDKMVAVVNGDQLMVTLDNNYNPGKLSLYNMLGYLMDSMPVEGNYCVFNIASLPPGIYLIVLSESVEGMVGKVFLP